MIKQTLMAAAVAFAAIGAQAADNETMYLVKGDRVVAKYSVDDVDYIAFNLADDVIDENIWLDVDKVGKNTVTYTVNTSAPNVAYAHALISYYDVNYVAQVLFDEMYDNLDEASRIYSLKYTMQSEAFAGIGTQSYTLNDFEQYDPSSDAFRFSVIPGTKYFLCAWEIDAVTEVPGEEFIFTELTTEAPAEVNLNLDVTFDKFNDYGMALNFLGSPNILYVRTVWGAKQNMEAYADYYGLDYLMGTFGQSWSMEFLAGTGDLSDDIENATWPVYDPGEYIMYVRAYDADGNMQEKSFTFEYAGSGDVDDENPVITILSKEKGDGFVKVNFEITPSNVDEAYVRLMDENTVDNRLNMGYTYSELAAGGDAIDITNEINTLGEYTYENKEVPEQWNSLLIFAKTKTGGKTTLRLNFWPDTETTWNAYEPKHDAPAARKTLKKLNIKRIQDPTIRK